MIFRCAIVSATLACLAAPVVADGVRDLQKIEASRVLYEDGVQNKDALLVIAAAKLRRSVGLLPTDRSPEEADAEPGDATDHIGWMAMLDTAKSYSVGDDLMLGLIEDIESETTKGVVNGPVFNVGRVDAKRSHTYRSVPFDGSKYAEIYIEAKGSNDLNLYIYDAQDRLVCSDTDNSAIAYCGWTPRATANFSIKVSNESSARAQYSLITN